MAQIAEYEKLEGSALNEVKVVLADAATSLLHGQQCLSSIHSTVKSLFNSNNNNNNNSDDEATLDSLPRFSVSSSAVQSSAVSVVHLLVTAQLSTSRNEARRLIRAGGIRINNEKVDDEMATISLQDFVLLKNRVKLSHGKKKHVVFVLEDDVVV